MQTGNIKISNVDIQPINFITQVPWINFKMSFQPKQTEADHQKEIWNRTCEGRG